MTAGLIAISAGLLLGSAWAATVGGYLLLTRSYRQVRNLIVIGFGYLVVGTVSIGSLLLLFLFCDIMGFVRPSPSYHAALYSYAFSSTCVVFLAGRAESRWRKSVGLDDRTLISK
jgi:hypothetical protein